MNIVFWVLVIFIGIAAFLTSELIEKQKIEKWNGSVPQVQGDSTPIVKISE